MLFTTDRQTLEDLNIFGKNSEASIFEFYNRTSTQAGNRLLRQFFNEPLSNAEAINNRCNVILFFSVNAIAFPFKDLQVDAIESYLQNTDQRSRLSAREASIARKLESMIAPDLETKNIYSAISELVELINRMRKFIAINAFDSHTPFAKEITQIRSIISSENVALKIGLTGKEIKRQEMVDLDDFFRFHIKEQLLLLINFIAQVDVYCSVAEVAKKYGLTFPIASESKELKLSLQDVYHPLLSAAIPNSIELDKSKHIVFLTGANMAGKSTFMKSISTALFLAHMGFPVSASKMEFSVLDGIYTTINLPDNLGMGASHFYSEVIRAKKIALELKTRNLFVLFDELFRGTNVKDACEATVAFAKAFATHSNSMFVLSTHIIEAGALLKESLDSIDFLYLPTMLKDGQPVYTYKLETGITSDRHGMVIIENEGIIKILDDGLKNIKQ